MKKGDFRWLIVFFLFLSISLVSAVTEKVIMDTHTSYSLNGKNITLIGVSGNRVNLNIDGVIGVAERDQVDYLNGVKVNVTGISITPPKAIMYLTVDFICGDNVCSNLESQIICCKDCGCLGSNVCLNNMCVQNISQPQATYECYQTNDCEDNDPCTVDSCNQEGIPFRCEHTRITACINDDRCCPLTCEDTQDNDCINIDRCKRHNDCDDGNPCTSETCEGIPKRCKFVKTEGCVLKNKCTAFGTIDLGKYCATSGLWLNKILDNEKCSEDYECFSGVCTLKVCGKNSFILNIFRISTFLSAALVLILLIFYFTISSRRK